MTLKEEEQMIAPPVTVEDNLKAKLQESVKSKISKEDVAKAWPFPLSFGQPKTSTPKAITLDVEKLLSQNSAQSPAQPSAIAGFFVNKKDFKYCKHPEHKVPSMIVVPQGQIYIHTCPKCKKQSYAESPAISLSSSV